MFENNITPANDSDAHWPFELCPCGPVVQTRDGMKWLVHHAFDKREQWMEVEMMLGMRCKPHAMLIDRSKPSEHVHIHAPPPHYEYSKEDHR